MPAFLGSRRRSAAVGAGVLLTLAGCSATSGAPVAEPPDRGEVGVMLAGLAVKGRAPSTGYSRARFGPAWEDVDRNGCDTRNDVLARDLVDETLRPARRSCVVLTGTLTDPYTGRLLRFDKSDADAVQIDHVVALSDAWQKGASTWSTERRTAFANDPDNLQATDGPTNQRKGNADAASWLPPSKGYRCTYVSRQIGVKAEYGLWVTPAERDSLAAVLDGCPP